MVTHLRLVCLSSLATLLLSSPMLAISSPLPAINGTTSSHNISSVKIRAIPQFDADGWIPFDSVGMMLPVKLNDDDTTHPNDCTTVDCKQHMDYASNSNGAPLPPGPGLSRRDLPRQGSRDIARRKAQVGFDDLTGEPVYSLAKSDDENEEQVGDSAEEGVEQDYSYDQDEAGDYESEGGEEGEDDEDDESEDDSDREALAKRHLPLVRGVSVPGTPTFSRRDDGILSRLFRRKKQNSKKVDLDELKKKRRKSKSTLKGRTLNQKLSKRLQKKEKESSSLAVSI